MSDSWDWQSEARRNEKRKSADTQGKTGASPLIYWLRVVNKWSGTHLSESRTLDHSTDVIVQWAREQERQDNMREFEPYVWSPTFFGYHLILTVLIRNFVDHVTMKLHSKISSVVWSCFYSVNFFELKSVICGVNLRDINTCSVPLWSE